MEVPQQTLDWLHNVLIGVCKLRDYIVRLSLIAILGIYRCPPHLHRHSSRLSGISHCTTFDRRLQQVHFFTSLEASLTLRSVRKWPFSPSVAHDGHSPCNLSRFDVHLPCVNMDSTFVSKGGTYGFRHGHERDGYPTRPAYKWRR